MMGSGAGASGEVQASASRLKRSRGSRRGFAGTEEDFMKITKVSGVLALLLIAAAAACGKGEQPAEANATVEVTATAESAMGEGAYVEEHESGKAAFNVAADGNVKAAVTGPDGKPIRENVSGTLLWKGPSGEEKTVRSEERRVGKECRSRWSQYH